MTKDRPVVTFALLSYNQEGYIGAAVDAALAQNYSPLEVIISDDSSTDGTYEEILRILSQYNGPHEVIARRTLANRGSMLHVSEVAALARGKLLVLAAGDDISKWNRTSVLVSQWQASGAWGLCSRFDRIDQSGKLLETSVLPAVLSGRGFKDFFYEEEGPVRIVHGCSSAYDIRAFEYLKLGPQDYILAEDGTMSVLLNLIGKPIVNLDDSLVYYRESPSSLTNNRVRDKLTFAKIVEDERRIERFAGAQANRCRLFLGMNDYLGAAQTRRMKVGAVEAELARQMIRASWGETAFIDRVSFAMRDRRSTWALPRLFGLNLFYLAKWLSRRFSKDREESR